MSEICNIRNTVTLRICKRIPFRSRWVLNEDSGNLIAYQLRRQDEGMYRCIAENAAGRIEAESFLDVVIRPKVQELFNKTFPINHPEGRIVCKASGDPLPDIIWRKWSRK